MVHCHLPAVRVSVSLLNCPSVLLTFSGACRLLNRLDIFARGEFLTDVSEKIRQTVTLINVKAESDKVKSNGRM